MKNKLLQVLIALLTGFTCTASAADDPLTYGLELDLGFGQDSNVAIDDVDLSLSQADNFTDLGISADLQYKPDSNWDLGASISVIDKRYRTFEEFDGRLIISTLNADRDIGPVTAGLNLRHIEYELDGSHFLRATQASPSLSWFPSRNLYVRFDALWSDETFVESGDRNNRQKGMGGTAYLFINGLKHYWLVRMNFSSDVADDERFSNDAREMRILYHRHLPVFSEEASLDFIYRFQHRQYDSAREPLIDEFREDRRGRAEVRFNYQLRENLEMSARFSRANYRSNLDSAAFQQKLYQLKLTYELPFS